VGLPPVEANGTLQADGSLVLDQKPNLPPGRVRVTLQPVADAVAPGDDLISRMQALWADQEARGYVPRTREEIDAGLEELRNDAEEEMQEIERLHEECMRQRAAPPPDEESPG
jgi:hypothetical protein